MKHFAKLDLYEFSLSVFLLIGSYLANRKQNAKINSSYGWWEEILAGVPQESFQRPSSFKMLIYASLIKMA